MDVVTEPTVQEEPESKKAHLDEHHGPFLTKIYWRFAIGLILYHLDAVYVLFTFPFLEHYKTALFADVLNIAAGLGVTAGVHRCFTHRSYKATKTLKVLLLVMYSFCGLQPVRIFVRDHRVHHKCSDTMGDPYSARRGCFFSHIGWLGLHKTKEFKKYSTQVDISDVLNDPITRFFDEHFLWSMFLSVLVVPTMIPMLLWNESLYYALQMSVLRHVMIMNLTFCINGFAHTFGERTFNSKIHARENLFLAIVTNGEGYHNYHHTFPYDYKASDRGKLNVGTYFIDLVGKLGLAYDMKEAGPESVRKMMLKYGG